MLIRFKKGMEGSAAAAARRRLAALLPGARARPERGALSVTGFRPELAADAIPLLENLPGVASVSAETPELCPLTLSRRPQAFPLDFSAGFLFIAGPCAVEDEASYLATAEALKRAGAHALRAALFKPRSSPYAFQGAGFAGLKTVTRARKATGLPLVTEVVDTRHVEKLAGACDVLQIGARNMRNYELLKEAGAARAAVLLKRAMRATLREWLLSAEYLLRHGARALVLCERGDAALSGDKPGLDLDLMLEARRLTGLPVVADPSHAARDRDLAAALALKAARAGADGLLVEASLAPQAARVDGRQTMTVRAFSALVRTISCERKR